MRALKYVVVLLFVLCAEQALAWGKFGHVVICEIAYRELTDEARTVLNRLLIADGEHTSFNRACLLADRFPRTKPKAHFANYPRETQTIADAACGGADTCVISEIASDFQRTADTSLSDAERGRAMVLLGHWVGDIHQPLHISFSDDKGGNSIRKRGRCGARNLHAVWDSCIVEDRVLPGNSLARFFGWQKFTRAYRAADRLSPLIEKSVAEEWISTEPFQWAAESYAIAIDVDTNYCHLRSGACWYEPNNKVLDSGETERTIQMTDEYLDRFLPVVENRLQQAGVRLAHLLQQALTSGTP